MITDVQCFDSTGAYPFSGSDHYLIVSNFYARDMCVDSLSHQFVFVRNFQQLDTDKLDGFLMYDDIWDDVLSRFDNISDCLECFNPIVNRLLEFTKLRVRQQDCPWLSSASLTKACRLCDIAHCKALRSGSASDWSLYRSLHDKANFMLRSAKVRHFSDLSSSLGSNPGKFWRHFQSLSKCSKPHSDIQFSATADTFNKHFLSIPHRTILVMSLGQCLTAC